MTPSNPSSTRAQGFTLIELMVTVSLIGILAAMAITSFNFYQLRSRRSEAYVNLAAIKTYQLSFFHEAGGFVDAPPSPAFAPLGPGKQQWHSARGTFSSNPGFGFDVLAFVPEGGTYFDYDTNAPVGANAFTASAYGDTDGDGFLSAFMYVAPDPAGVSLPSRNGLFTVPWDNNCQPLLNTVAQVPYGPGACPPPGPTADDY